MVFSIKRNSQGTDTVVAMKDSNASGVKGWVTQLDSEVNHFLGGTHWEGKAVINGRIMGVRWRELSRPILEEREGPIVNDIN
jgi:hypothetical protein